MAGRVLTGLNITKPSYMGVCMCVCVCVWCGVCVCGVGRVCVWTSWGVCVCGLAGVCDQILIKCNNWGVVN